MMATLQGSQYVEAATSYAKDSKAAGESCTYWDECKKADKLMCAKVADNQALRNPTYKCWKQANCFRKYTIDFMGGKMYMLADETCMMPPAGSGVKVENPNMKSTTGRRW